MRAFYPPLSAHPTTTPSSSGLTLFISQKRNLALRGCHIGPTSPSYNLNPGRRPEKTAHPGPHSRRVLSPAGPGPGSPRPCPARAPASPGRPHRENRLARRARVAQLHATSLRPAGAPRLLGVASCPHGAPGPQQPQLDSATGKRLRDVTGAPEPSGRKRDARAPWSCYGNRTAA